MIRPKNNWLIRGFFSFYISYIIKRNFHSVYFNRVELQQGKAVLLIANHFSWWDGFLLYHINRIHFKKTFRCMVLEDTMHQVKFFKYLGGFSVAKQSREVLESINYAAELLNDPKTLLVIFPQGKLYSNFVDGVQFEKGLFKITELATADFQYVLATTFTENFDHQKPTANITFKVIPKEKIANATDIQQIYEKHYQLARHKQTQIVV